MTRRAVSYFEVDTRYTDAAVSAGESIGGIDIERAYPSDDRVSLMCRYQAQDDAERTGIHDKLSRVMCDAVDAAYSATESR